MSFGADLLITIFCVVYLILNRHLYRWRLEVSKKYPHNVIINDYLSFKDSLRNTWELLVSVALLSGLYIIFLAACSWPLSFSHTPIQLIVVLSVLYWLYTFVSVATYPTSHQLIRWLGKKLLNRHPG